MWTLITEAFARRKSSLGRAIIDLPLVP